MANGEILVITGPNGGGKSTLAKLIMGIGYAFQQPPRFKGITVKKLLNLAAGRKVDEEICCKYLSSVGLCAKEYINREIDSMILRYG